jgi:hypothetical protein
MTGMAVVVVNSQVFVRIGPIKEEKGGIHGKGQNSFRRDKEIIPVCVHTKKATGGLVPCDLGDQGAV